MKDRIKLAIFWIASFLVIISIMTFKSYAADPVYFPMQQNQNGLFSENVINYINNTFDYENNYIFCRTYGTLSGGRPAYTVFYFPKSSGTMYYAEVQSNGYKFNLYKVGNTNPIQKYFYVNNGTITQYQWTQSSFNADFSNLNSSLYSSSVDYVSNFKLYTNNTDSAELILKYGPDPVPPLDIGVAIIPPDAIVPEYPSGTTPPSQVPPTYTATDYNWTTPPTFDSSSIENAIGSIQNTLGWIANNLKEEFKNLTNNLKGFFKYIGDTIQYYGNVIISTLNNFIQNFYDNMKALVEPIFQKIDYITTPLEADVIWDNISGTSLITNYSSIINAATSMKSSFENLSEPTDYKIPIHLEDLPSSWFGNLTTQYIDLGVINPVKNILRTFMWALITYSLFVTIIDSIANYINGGGDES